MARLTQEQFQAIIDIFNWSNNNKEITGDIFRQYVQNLLDSFAEGLLTDGTSIEAAIQELRNRPGGSDITFSDQFSVSPENEVSMAVDLIEGGDLSDIWDSSFFTFNPDLTNIFKSYLDDAGEHIFTFAAYSTTGGSNPPACLGIAPNVVLPFLNIVPNVVTSGQYRIQFDILVPALPSNVNGLYVRAEQVPGTEDGNKIIPFSQSALWQSISLDLNLCSVPVNPLALIEFFFVKPTGSSFQTVEDDEMRIRNLIVSKL